MRSITTSPDYIVTPSVGTFAAPIDPCRPDFKPSPGRPPPSSVASLLLPPPCSAPSSAKGFGSFSPPSHSAPSVWNALPAHFPHSFTLQDSAPRSLLPRSPLELTPTFSVVPRNSSSCQSPQSAVVSCYIFENDDAIDTHLPPLDHGSVRMGAMSAFVYCYVPVLATGTGI